MFKTRKYNNNNKKNLLCCENRIKTQIKIEKMATVVGVYFLLFRYSENNVPDIET